MSNKLKAPFPYFGGKTRIAGEVWRRFGKVQGYLEPFGGSLGVALRNPHPEELKIENLNDLNGYVANFWRAIQANPGAVADWCDWPVCELDLHARHRWLVESPEVQGLAEKLRVDPDYFDAKIAGWWVWGISQWVAGGWCDGSLRQSRPYLRDFGRGVHQKGWRGKLPEIFEALQARLRYSRVTCCDWKSLQSSLRPKVGQLTGWGIFLDPPYTHKTGRCNWIYGKEESATLGEEVARWAIEIGDTHRVALCGIAGEYDIPDTWEVYEWKTLGFSHAGRDRGEVVWFSPACLP